MMQWRAAVGLRSVVLITGCGVVLGGCAAIRHTLTPTPPFPWETEMGAAATESAALPPEAAAMGHFLAAEVALNQGDHETATKEYARAVAADPSSPLLRERLAALYVRANRLQEALTETQKAVELDPEN